MSAGREGKPAAPRRSAMVGWYDPRQLLVTGMQTVVSSLFGRRADFRLLQSLQAEAIDVDYRKEAEVWVDYIADVGDGFNPTYALARTLARPSLTVRGERGDEELPRGRILVMGGDEVYPTPSPARYQERLVMPYSCALPDAQPKAVDLFAIPGNHDWYDGLASFINLFCHGHRIGGYATPQKRSYFALRFAGGFWLFGVDVQLDGDLDNRQLEAFCRLEGVARGDRVILCVAEPFWVYEARRARTGGPPPPWRSNLERLEDHLAALGATVVLKIAGDLHHYRHHAPRRGGPHLVTAGGGGAFLHPTHTRPVNEIPIGAPPGERTHELAAQYPDTKTSFRLSFRNLAFPFYNPYFGLTTGAAYMILSWVMPPPALAWERPAPEALGLLLRSGFESLALAPSGLLWVLLILLGFVAFTDADRRAFKWGAGLLHGSAHLAASLLVASVTLHLAGPEVHTDALYARLAVSLGGFAGGYLVGGLLMGIYLLIAVTLFGCHDNEAFSSLKIEGYKNFLRMRLDEKGLTVWALGLRRVPPARAWRWVDQGEGKGHYELRPGVPEPAPELVDRFEIRIDGGSG
ncbi:MAG TPA: calcineurin [Polyangiaceae bacterium]|nr:calcineurin [Polyangiaceae bacterium]